MLTPRKIASNTTWYIIALALQKVVSFVYFTIIARYLGPQDTGKYFFAVSLTVIFAVLADIGFSHILTREVAKFKEQANKLVSQVFTLKIITSLIAVGLIAVIAPLLTSDPVTIQLIIIATVAMVLDGFTLIFYSAIRGKQNLKYESLATIIHQLIVLGVGVYFIQKNASVTMLVYALLVASIFNFLYSFWAASRKMEFRIRLLWDTNTLKSITAIILPFALAVIFTRVYAYIDTVLLQSMKGEEAVGIYSVAYKITFAFQFLPLAFIAALYPAFSYYWQHDKEMLYVSFSKALQYLIIIVLPISFGLITLAPVVIPALYTSDFTASIRPLQILLLTLPFLFLNFVLGSMLNACSKQRWQTTILGIGMIFNIVINLVLIPILGPVGAAAASTSSTIVVFIISIIAIGRIASFDYKLIITTAYKTVLICTAMSLAIIALLNFIAWYFTVIAAGCVYLAGLWFLKLLNKDDLRSFKSSLNRN